MSSNRSLLDPLMALAIGSTLSLTAGRAAAQAIDLTNRPIAEIQVTGLEEVPERLVRNHIRSKPGDPYDPQVVHQDIVRITHLGRFDQVIAKVSQRDDGSVLLRFEMVEQPLLADVQVVGNKVISDQKLLAQVVLRSGDAADQFLIDRGVRQIRQAYEKKGYFQADVLVDQGLLKETGILVYRVVEGPKLRLKGIDFEGNEAFTNGQIRSKIRSKTYIPILRQGELSREELDLDAARIRRFYEDRGYLDAKVGRGIAESDDQRDAVVVFIVEEGPKYLVGAVRVNGNKLFPAEQIRLNMALAPGDAYSLTKDRASKQTILEMYGKVGYLETQVEIDRLFHKDQPTVDLDVTIDEGRFYLVGTVTVRGDDLTTKSKVILRQVRGMSPGRRFDGTGVDQTLSRLNDSPLFDEGTVTLLGEPEDPVRDVLIEVKEAQTGSLEFGAGVSSDLGIGGRIGLTQRNFDIADPPESFKEMFSGRAFRGAGQFFSLVLQPGNDNSRYSVNFREPYAFETDYLFDSSLFFFESTREDWDEQRFGGGIGVGQRFGDVWSALVRVRANEVDISEIQVDAPVDVFAVAGGSFVSGLGFLVKRNATDSFVFPTRGHKIELGLERVGALGGDFGFTHIRTEFLQFWTVDEDFFGRKTVLSLRTEVAYILEDDEAPLFERFYAGGHRTFRGFEFRGVGPRGIRADTGVEGNDPVGGDWLLLAGLEYNFPIWQELLRAVFFTDMGTVQKDPGLDDWRVSIGTGLRLKIPFLGRAPFALDLAVPLLKQDADEEQLVSFNLALPLQ